MDGQALKLRRPIVFAGKTYAELRFPNEETVEAGAFEKLPAGGEMDLGDFLRLAERLCELPDSTLSHAHPKDIHRIVAVVSSFFEDEPSTGSGSS